MSEDRYCDNPSYFVTLTFDDLLIPEPSLSSELNKDFLHKFMKRFSKKLQYHKLMDEVRYFACGEYGDLGRAHYHFIMFDVPCLKDDFRVLVQDSWPYGFVTCEPISDARCMYCAKYTCKELFEDDFYSEKKQKPFASISTGRSKGKWLGYKFLEDKSAIKRLKDEQMFFVRSSNGSVFNLPSCYKNRLFSPYERELHNDFLLMRSEKFFNSYASGLKNAFSTMHKNLFYEQQFFKRLSDQRKQLFEVERCSQSC